MDCVDKAIPHGTNNGYQWYKCRCEECVAAHKTYRRKHYEANREKTALQLRAWRAANPEKTTAQKRRYRASNPEKEAERQRAWRDANPDYGRLWRESKPEYFREWAAANPERAAELRSLADHRYRTRKKSAFVEDVPRLEIFERDGWKCMIPGCVNPETLASLDVPHTDPNYASVDHIVPLSKGGLHERSNLACAHLRCNVLKRDHLEGIA